MAREKGLVYSPVDGDQPALLMAMVEWARSVGLTVISAGKARDGEFVLDEELGTVSISADGITVHEDYVAHVSPEDMKYFHKIPSGKAGEYLEGRAKALAGLPGAGAFDLCELTMIANATGLKPARPELTDGILRITELPVAYCTRRDGGIYQDEGIIDVHTNLRRRDESGMGGGVYMVVRCDNAYSNYILTTKGRFPMTIALRPSSTAPITCAVWRSPSPSSAPLFSGQTPARWNIFPGSIWSKRRSATSPPGRSWEMTTICA